MITCPVCNKTMLSPEDACPYCGHLFEEGPWVVIKKVSPPEDRILESLIRSFNVPVRLIQESIASVTGISIGPLAEVKIAVPRAYAQYVLEMLEASNEE